MERGQWLSSWRLRLRRRTKFIDRIAAGDPATTLGPGDPDQGRRREEVQGRADEVEAPADRLSRLRVAVLRLDSEPTLLSATRRIRRRLPGDEKFGDPLSTAGRTPVEVIAR